MPSFLEPRRRAEQALVAVVQEAYVNGVSTRKVDRLVEQLGVQGEITENQYTQAYRLCDNYVARVRQIESICDIGQSLDEIVGRPLIGTALQLAKVPALRRQTLELLADEIARSMEQEAAAGATA